MGKASRLRRQKKEKERQNQRATQGQGSQGSRGDHGGHGFGSQATSSQHQAAERREQVSALIGKALRAILDGDQPAFTRVVDQLAAERAPGWTQAVSRYVVEFLGAAVTNAWQAGWQPAELARHASAVMGAAHASMAADMIAAEMKTYAAATIDPRWAAQVTAVAPDGIWWGTDAEYLAAWRGRAGEPNPTAPVATAVETLDILLHLRPWKPCSPSPETGPPARCRTRQGIGGRPNDVQDLGPAGQGRIDRVR